jgi:aminopeptidase-like protein
MLELIRLLHPHAMAPVSSGADVVAELLCQHLPFTVHAYPSGAEHNGWIVPQKWEVKQALLYREGELVFDGRSSLLGVFGYSRSFQGELTWEELRPHLSSRPDFPEVCGYHCDLYYKPHLADWGFSIPHRLYERLGAGRYQVDLQTEFSDGEMKVLDYFLAGESPLTLAFNAHNCHPVQSNDDLAGIAVGIEVMRALAERDRRRYSYRLVIAPEHFGTVFYLAGLSREERARFVGCTFLEMLGNDNRLLLQRSFSGDSWLDWAAEHVLRHHASDVQVSDFRTSVGNDETVWDAAGYEIPTVSLSRWPFPQYHTEYDNPEHIHPQRLEEAVQVVLAYIDILETNCTVERQFEGLVALSNPKYGLYKPMWDPSKGLNPYTAQQVAWNRFMNYVPRYFDGRISILEMAERHGLPYRAVYDYLCAFKAKGLVRFAPTPILGQAPPPSRLEALRRIPST